jgi:hypothetical protein
LMNPLLVYSPKWFRAEQLYHWLSWRSIKVKDCEKEFLKSTISLKPLVS